MKPAKPLTVVVNVQILPSSATTPAGTFGVVTINLSTLKSGEDRTIQTGPLCLFPSGVRELVAQVLAAQAEAERLYGKEPAK